MLLLPPSNKDHLSEKRILFFANLPVAPFFKCPTTFLDFGIQTVFCLLGFLVLFTHEEFHQFQGSICLCIRGDLWHKCRFEFQDDKEKMPKNATDEKEAAVSRYELFTAISCYVVSLHSTQNLFFSNPPFSFGVLSKYLV